MKHLIGKAQNGASVYVNLIGSQAALHIARQPQLLTLVKEMLRHITVKGAGKSIEHDMGRSVGYSFIIPTAGTDNIFYGCLPKDDVFMRFIKNGKPLSTNYLSITVTEDGDSYELSDIRIGRYSPPRPGSTDETADSRDYWSSHAFVPDSQSLQLRTVTKTCPY